MRVSESLIIGIDISENGDNTVLIVGRKQPGGKAIDIVNAFQGEEAVELYKKLITKKEK